MPQRFSLILAAFLPALALAQFQPMSTTSIGGANDPLTIEVWSDLVCPFCYIGKRELENALKRFPHRNQVKLVWKSFELDANAPDRALHDTYGMLMERYRIGREEAVARVSSVTQRAAGLGLKYDYDKVIVGSSFQAHRLLQYARSKGKGDAMKERLFLAYFTEGKHLADRTTLVSLAKEAGLNADEVRYDLEGDAWIREVRSDEQEARQIGVSGVPFFAFDRRFAVSGAQPSDVFLKALEKAWAERGK
jgi:predicted DsbA family dithiol-disulfide isomerase